MSASGRLHPCDRKPESDHREIGGRCQRQQCGSPPVLVLPARSSYTGQSLEAVVGGTRPEAVIRSPSVRTLARPPHSRQLLVCQRLACFDHFLKRPARSTDSVHLAKNSATCGPAHIQSLVTPGNLQGHTAKIWVGVLALRTSWYFLR
jgi:hypothetical protein